MKKKFKLDELKVQSFVTDLRETKENMLGGAIATVNDLNCAETVKSPNCISNVLYSACRTCGIVCYPEG